MKTGNVFRPSLDDRACATVRLGRELSRLAEALFPVDGADADIVARTLRRLADRNPFDPDDVTLRALRAILKAELGEELAGSERRIMAPGGCVLPAAPTLGSHDVQSARAQELAHFLEVFDRFLSSRDATLDQVAAERALVRLIGPNGSRGAAPKTAEGGASG